MAILTKAGLSAAIATVFASASRITAAQARSWFGDAVDSLLAQESIQASDTSIIIDRSVPGQVRLRADTSGGTPTPTQYPTLYFGTSADATPSPAELSIQGANGQGTILQYAGNRHHLVARLASEGDIHSIIYSDDPSRDNAIGAFTRFASTVVPAGESEPFNVWVSNQSLMHPNDATLTVT